MSRIMLPQISQSLMPNIIHCTYKISHTVNYIESWNAKFSIHKFLHLSLTKGRALKTLKKISPSEKLALRLKYFVKKLFSDTGLGKNSNHSLLECEIYHKSYNYMNTEKENHTFKGRLAV